MLQYGKKTKQTDQEHVFLDIVWLIRQSRGALPPLGRCHQVATIRLVFALYSNSSSTYGEWLHVPWSSQCWQYPPLSTSDYTADSQTQ